MLNAQISAISISIIRSSSPEWQELSSRRRPDQFASSVPPALNEILHILKVFTWLMQQIEPCNGRGEREERDARR